LGVDTVDHVIKIYKDDDGKKEQWNRDCPKAIRL
jgi:hypothetical protein